MLAVVLDVASWLGALDGWQAALTSFGSVAATLVGIVWPIVHAHRKARAAAWERADKPVAPTVKPPPLPPVDPRLEHMAKQLAEVTAWSLDDARAEVRRLQAEVAELKADLSASEKFGNELQRAVIAADNRAYRAIEELKEHKRASTSGVTTRSATITPLRPPAKREPA